MMYVNVPLISALLGLPSLVMTMFHIVVPQLLQGYILAAGTVHAEHEMEEEEEEEKKEGRRRRRRRKRRYSFNSFSIHDTLL